MPMYLDGNGMRNLIRHAARERAGRVRAALAWTAAACAACLALAWTDVLPGGWRLRGLVEPHAEREAQERALHMAARLRAFAAEAVPEGAIVFLGSSTIERFPLERLFPGRRCVNRGISGARADEIVAHLDRVLPAARPAAVVLYAAGPDRLATPLDTGRVLSAADRLIGAVHSALPGVPVLVLGLLPSTRTRGAEARALERIDAGLADLALRRGYAHLRLCDPPLADAGGALVESLSSDGIHLSEAGYDLLAGRLRALAGPVGDLLDG